MKGTSFRSLLPCHSCRPLSNESGINAVSCLVTESLLLPRQSLHTRRPYIPSTRQIKDTYGICTLTSRCTNLIAESATRFATIEAQLPIVCPGHRREHLHDDELHATRNCSIRGVSCGSFGATLSPKDGISNCLPFVTASNFSSGWLVMDIKLAGDCVSIPTSKGIARRCVALPNPLPVKIYGMAVLSTAK
jgi:hypothetical protein